MPSSGARRGTASARPSSDPHLSDRRTDRLAALVHGASTGSPPPVDFQTELLPRPPGSVSAALGFTGHHAVAADVTAAWFEAARDPDDFGSVMQAPFLAALGAAIGARPGHLDVVLVGRAGAGSVHVPELVPVDPGSELHPRLQRALDYRSAVRAWTTPDGAGLVTVGRGLADRYEVSFEVDPSARGRGLGSRLASAALALVPTRAPVFAQVSPGNVASLRVLLAAGYVPIGSEVLFLHR